MTENNIKNHITIFISILTLSKVIFISIINLYKNISESHINL